MDQAQQEPVDGPKNRIAVMPFDVKVHKAGSIGNGLSDMLADGLVNSNRFIVLERQHVKDVMAEQDLGRSGRVKKETAPQIKQACVAINMRIIDAKTGRVLNATTVDGSAMTAGVGPHRERLEHAAPARPRWLVQDADGARNS